MTKQTEATAAPPVDGEGISQPSTFASRRAARLAREAVHGVPERAPKTLKAGPGSTGGGASIVRVNA